MPYTQDFAIEITPLGINEPASLLSTIHVYPNPTTGELIITFGEPQALSGDLQVEIVNVSGKMVASHYFSTLFPQHKIDISHLDSGVYFVKIGVVHGEVVRKVVKQ